MAVTMNDVYSIAIPQGDVDKINDGSNDIWYKQDTIDVDLFQICQDNVGWWNYAWTSCSGFGTDTNWSWSAWIPVADGGKLTYKLYLHQNVGHLTAWDVNGNQLGYICGKNGKSMVQSEWELPAGTRWLRICIAYPGGSIGQGRDQNVRYVGKSPLPRRYKLLDSITSVGAQYIDTGLTPDANHVIDMYMTPTEPTGDSKFFGMYGGGIAGAFLGCYNSKWRIGSGLKGSTIPIVGSTIAKVRTQNQGATWYIGDRLNGGQSETCTGIATGNDTYLLFGSRFGGTGQPPIQYGKMKCSLLRIGVRQNASYALVTQKPVLCMLPCRDRSTGQLGMYDVVTDTFHGNLGSGSFTGRFNLLNTCTTAGWRNHSDLIQGDGTDPNWQYGVPVEINGETKITCNMDGYNTVSSIMYYDANMNVISYISAGGTTITPVVLTDDPIPNNAKYVAVCCHNRTAYPNQVCYME